MTELNRRALLVADRAAALVLYARQWSPDADAAEDVVQEALTALLGQPAGAVADPVAWMFRAVRNGAIDRARTDSRRRRRERAAAEARREWFETTPDAAMDAAAAEAALRALSPDAREIVVLRIWGDVGFTQIAEIMHRSVSTVHGKYVEALRQLRDAMETPCRTNADQRMRR
jgi:RNA polymerase sigma factor (sigma-70 family)